MVRSHLNMCETCAVLLLETEFTVSLCRSFPELEPPPQLVERVLERTTGQRTTLSWVEYLRDLLRPLYASPRFATGACLAVLSLTIVMNALGVDLSQVRWNELTPRNVMESLNRTVNVAYDKGLRRLNDLKILYQIQSKIDELRTNDEGESEKKAEPEPKSKQYPQENSATEHLFAWNLLAIDQSEL
jgi:hypothetical protein